MHRFKQREVAVILTDAEKKIIWVNDAFLYISGYTLFEVLGKGPGDVLQGQNTCKETINLISKSLKKQQAIETTILNYRKSGEPYLCHLAIHPVVNDQKILTNFIAFEVDESNYEENLNLSLLQVQKKYTASSLNPIGEISLIKKLNIHLSENALYLDPDIDIKTVAAELKSNIKYLSQVVNNQTGLNFNQYINQFRIQILKESLKDKKYDSLTLYEIAQHCGFKNKSTFHKVFRAFTQMTPKEFLQQYRNGKNEEL
jgi:PAS domain S-box-containing protein